MNHLLREIVQALSDRQYTITTAESCTGGMLASSLVDIAGVSEVFHQGYITYSEDAKCKMLGMEKSVIDQFGVVSEETVIAMARGAAMTAQADVALATTGVAGPDGGTKEHPVGEVWIGCYLNGNICTKRILCKGNRMQIRQEATKEAFALLREGLRQE